MGSAFCRPTQRARRPLGIIFDQKIVQKWSLGSPGPFFDHFLSILDDEGSPPDHFRTIFGLFLEDPGKMAFRQFVDNFPWFPIFTQPTDFNTSRMMGGPRTLQKTTKIDDFGSRIELSSSNPDRNDRTDLPHLFGIVNRPGKAVFGSKMKKWLKK